MYSFGNVYGGIDCQTVARKRILSCIRSYSAGAFGFKGFLLMSLSYLAFTVFPNPIGEIGF